MYVFNFSLENFFNYRVFAPDSNHLLIAWTMAR